MPDQLSSDLLNEQFGPVKFEVLYQKGNQRIICNSLHGKVLELSYVKFNPQNVERFSKIHNKILNGYSIGQSFRDASLKFKRNERSTYKYLLTDSFQNWFKSQQSATVKFLSIHVGDHETHYADIVETYNPIVKLSAEAGQPSRAEIIQIDEFEAVLARLRSVAAAN